MLAEREGNFARASEIKYGQLVKLEQKLTEQQAKLKETPHQFMKQEVDETDIAKVLERWTGIPAEKLQVKDSQKLLLMAQELKKKVIGQDQAIDTIVDAIQLHRTGISDPHKPIGIFLF